MSASKPSAASAPYEADFAGATAQYGLPDGLLREVARQESGFNPNAGSSAGAVGLMQFMPDTAAGLGVDPTDPTSAIYGAARYLAQLNGQEGGDWALTLAAYNAGPGAVKKYGGIPPYAETQDYVRLIFGKLGWKGAGVPKATAKGTTGADVATTGPGPVPSTSATSASSAASTGLSGWSRIIAEGLVLIGGVALVGAGIYQATTGKSAAGAVKTKATDAAKVAAADGAKLAVAA